MSVTSLLEIKKVLYISKYVEDDKFTVVPPLIGCRSIPLYSGTNIYLILVTAEPGLPTSFGSAYLS